VYARTRAGAPPAGGTRRRRRPGRAVPLHVVSAAPYLGGCSLAARADGSTVRLVRNYDLSPDLNEGLLLRTEWTGMPVMGMVEFLWGLSDGVNAEGLSVALAFGRPERGGAVSVLPRSCATCSRPARPSGRRW
jgi:hypothetical protein